MLWCITPSLDLLPKRFRECNLEKPGDVHFRWGRGHRRGSSTCCRSAAGMAGSQLMGWGCHVGNATVQERLQYMETEKLGQIG